MNQKYPSSSTDKLDAELDRIFDLKPNDLSFPFLTNMYKFFTHPLKSLPLLYIVPISFFGAVLMYLLFGHMVIRFVSLLQYGF